MRALSEGSAVPASPSTRDTTTSDGSLLSRFFRFWSKCWSKEVLDPYSSFITSLEKFWLMPKSRRLSLLLALVPPPAKLRLRLVTEPRCCDSALVCRETRGLHGSPLPPLRRWLAGLGRVAVRRC